ncbi:hypothetical protein KDD30_13875 [Photobacterium sp. GJ3]|uniref:hypothetical protein n=1 Tax=Photobacterium sp. GJ3 TaxID=2829502 RepID=UPI001B8C6F27|nr:hypothetical protein [Photobacterium sp. GJ3]QUJ67138.1 hypothetical protein KDD30_13875 [Photobacterium sp. GJ3]
MSKFWRLLCFLVALQGFCTVSSAAAAECRLNSNQDLYIEFKIDPATLNESVFAVQSSGGGINCPR